MKRILATTALTALLAGPAFAHEDEQQAEAAPAEDVFEELLTPATDPHRRCDEMVQMVRGEEGDPPMHREPAAGDEAMTIYTVDLRVDDCSVLLTTYEQGRFRLPPALENNLTPRPAR